MIKIGCQLLLILFLVAQFLAMVWSDFNDRPAKKAAGFQGFIASVIAITTMTAVFYFAGLFDVVTSLDK